MLYDEADTRKQIRKACRAEVARTRKNPQLAQQRIEKFISDLREKNGDETLIAALENVLSAAKLLPIEQGKKQQIEEQLEAFLRTPNSHSERRIAKCRTTNENP